MWIVLLITLVAAGCSAGDDDTSASQSLPPDAYEREPDFSGGPSVGGGGDAEATFAGDDGGGADGFFEDEVDPLPDEQIDVVTEDNGIRPFIDTQQDPRSTFALDVDTGAYTVGRRYLEQGSLPPAASVRVEEYINAFDYNYENPDDEMMGLTIDGGPSPLAEDRWLVRVGVQAQRVEAQDRPAAHLTFVVDTSGSMDSASRLGLVRESLSLLVEQLNADDTVAIVTYSDRSGVVLQPTSVRDRGRILDAIARLEPAGSTNLEAGLRSGYELAAAVLVPGEINRVILASDGIANAGLTDPDALADLIRRDADRGIQLVTVGYGMNGFNDTLMEQIADQGDGFYAYVDTLGEAERLFEDELTSTLLTVALDAKIQVEFNRDVVAQYRLIGFENRGIRDTDFRNDDVDAGEVGAGHQVTAIYEIEFVRGVDIGDVREVVGEVHLRWEDPDTGRIIEIDQAVSVRAIEPRWTDTDEMFRLASTVAMFAELLRDSPYTDAIDMDQVLAEADRLADELRGDDIEELVDMIDAATRLG